MTDTTLSIELQGILLPEDVKAALQAQLRGLVLAEIARTDFGAELSIGPLPQSSRVFSHTNPILGFVVQKLSSLTVRSGGRPDLAALAPSTLFTPAHSPAELASIIEGLYYRPDIRAAAAACTKTLLDLLSRDEQAMQSVTQFATGQIEAQQPGPRLLTAVGVAVLAAGTIAVGALIGYAVNRGKHQ
jgi:hypothetical protein